MCRPPAAPPCPSASSAPPKPLALPIHSYFVCKLSRHHPTASCHPVLRGWTGCTHVRTHARCPTLRPPPRPPPAEQPTPRPTPAMQARVVVGGRAAVDGGRPASLRHGAAAGEPEEEGLGGVRGGGAGVQGPWCHWRPRRGRATTPCPPRPARPPASSRSPRARPSPSSSPRCGREGGGGRAGPAQRVCPIPSAGPPPHPGPFPAPSRISEGGRTPFRYPPPFQPSFSTLPSSVSTHYQPVETPPVHPHTTTRSTDFHLSPLARCSTWPPWAAPSW